MIQAMAAAKKTTKKSTKKASKKVGKKKMGRPTSYTDKIGDEICARMSAGESLLSICRDDHMPHRATVHGWLLATTEQEDGSYTKTFQNFYDKYALANELRAEFLFDETVDIADGTEAKVKAGAEKKSGAIANSQRLRVDTRKWYIGKVMPKKYSDKNVVVTEDKDGNQQPIQGNVITFASQNDDSKDGKTDD